MLTPSDYTQIEINWILNLTALNLRNKSGLAAEGLFVNFRAAMFGFLYDIKHKRLKTLIIVTYEFKLPFL